MRIVHRLPDGIYLESLYAHLYDIHVKTGQAVDRGQKIGRIGTADGIYTPHLHLELRENIYLPVGSGYGMPRGYLAPTPFILKHRRVKRTSLFNSSYNRLYSSNTNEAGLLKAARRGDLQQVRSLLQQKVNVNARDLNGETALMYAVVAGNVRMIKKLLAARARVGLRDKYGYSAYIKARLNMNYYPGILKLLLKEMKKDTKKP